MQMDVNEKRILEEFFSLVKIRCSTLQEREIADCLTEKLKAMGATVTEDNAGEILGGTAGNLVANFKGSVENAPCLMLTSHMDCVEPCENVKPILENGVIHSDGTTILGGDDKSGVVGILEAIRVLQENNVPYGDLQVVFNVAEEGGVNGSRVMDQSLLHADFGYALDTHGAPGAMNFKAPGKNQFVIKIEGLAAHAGIAPENGKNAIMAAAHLLKDAPNGRIDEETTCNCGKISGGTAANVVPDYCEIRYEARSRDKKKLDDLTEKIVKHFEGVEPVTGCNVTVEIKKDYDPYELDKNAPVLQTAIKAAESLQLPVELHEAGGGSDANHFNEFGIPTAVLACGERDAHTKKESILEKDLYNTARLVLAIIQEVSKMTK